MVSLRNLLGTSFIIQYITQWFSKGGVIASPQQQNSN